MDAVCTNNVEVIEVLLEANADVNLCNENGTNALGYAKDKNNAEILKLLYEKR